MKAWRLLAAVALAAAAGVQAQVGPTPAEAARYQGLHAAAQAGDAARIASLAAARTDLNARDPHGRTPLHVATFAKQRARATTSNGWTMPHPARANYFQTQPER